MHVEHLLLHGHAKRLVHQLLIRLYRLNLLVNGPLGAVVLSYW